VVDPVGCVEGVRGCCAAPCACVRAGAVLGLALVWCWCVVCGVVLFLYSPHYTCPAGLLRAPFCAARCAHGLFNENIPPKGNLVNIPEPSVG
jgi:hypothetical protein